MIQGRTLWELVEKRAQESPDALFLTDEGKRTMTFAEYRSAAERAAAGLAAMGVGENAPVTRHLPTATCPRATHRPCRLLRGCETRSRSAGASTRRVPRPTPRAPSTPTPRSWPRPSPWPSA